MTIGQLERYRLLRAVFSGGILLLLLAVTHLAFAGNLNISQTPLNQTVSVPPVMMLDLSRDQQLFYKAYNDYSDIDHDGSLDTTYEPSIDYYGYFNSNACYSYENHVFVPTGATGGSHYCNDHEDENSGGQWSGNFLNWASMSRLDVVRKILYGGYRSTDSADKTILERAPLPNDAHSWAKYYNGADLSKVTPFSNADGITLCNTTKPSSGYSQNNTNSPLIRVAMGNYQLWADSERFQCRWQSEINNYDANASGYANGHNGNDPAKSGIQAHEGSPAKGGSNQGFIARVQVCASGAGAGRQADCQRYQNGDYKPVGLLQQYSGTDSGIKFGLVTGSYAKNKSGGVLRKNADFFGDEINQSDGTFKPHSASGNIIGVLDALRIYNYSYVSGGYTDPNHDNCGFKLQGFSDGQCTDWGNPLSEIYLETLRYLAGKNANPDYIPSSPVIPDLVQATWHDSLDNDNYCAKLNVMVLNASVNSYDQVTGTGGLDIGGLSSLMKTISDGEGITGKSFFVGESGSATDQLCTKKTVDSLGNVLGVCPEAPRLKGSYDIAGLAYGAHMHSIRTDLPKNVQTVKTYGVALAPAVPEISIAVPGTSGQKVTILPACQRKDPAGSDCAIVDFKIVKQDLHNGTGKFYVDWEEAEQGGDYDADMWGTISYQFTGNNKIQVTTQVFAQSASEQLGFGYVIGGTSDDGFHVHSGAGNGTAFKYNDPNYSDPDHPDCRSGCKLGDPATTATYQLDPNSGGSLLQQPLYYAAKWGGFSDGNSNQEPDLTSEWDGNGDGIPDDYFYSTSPQDLVTSLAQVFANVQKESSSGTSLALNSGSISTKTQLFQAQYASTDWTGTLLAIPISNGSGGGNSTCGSESLGALCAPKWSAACELDGGACAATGTSGGSAPDPDTGRQLITYRQDQAKGVAFKWDKISTKQQNALNDTKKILKYLRGDQSKEQKNGGDYRNRSSRLGDIVHSTPLFVPQPNSRYPDTFHDKLYSDDGETGYAAFRTSHESRTHVVYAGANDGFLHAFDADNGKELFGFMPYKVSLKATALAEPGYNDSHRFFVDAPPTEADVYFGGDWHSMLVGGLGAGGQEVYALDVTDPSTFTQSNAASRVLWDFTDADDKDLGDTFGQPAIVRLHNGDWAALVGNGYNNTASDDHKSTSGDAVLYVLNISDGSVVKKLDTGAGITQDPRGQSLPNGITEVTPIDVDGDLITDYAVAGDLYGNVWVFDLTSQTPSDWSMTKLFQARGPNDKAQPITTKILANFHPKGQKYGVMLYFGTGKYFEVSDAGAHPDDVQTFYGVWDPDMSANFTTPEGFSTVTPPVSDRPLKRANLVEQTITQEGNLTQNSDGSLQLTAATSPAGLGSTALRVTSRNPVDYTQKMGWYLDLVSPNLGQQGEMVQADPSLIGNAIVFPTLIPSAQACGVSGTGWIMALNPETGGQLPSSPFDVNNDKTFSQSDLVTGGNQQAAAAGGTYIGGGGPSSQIFLGQARTIYTQMAGNASALNAINRQLFDPGLRFLGRKSWHEIR